MWKTVTRQYINIDLKDGKVYPVKDYSSFYEKIFAEPEKHICAQPELRYVLQKLRDQGKFLFIATNSHWEYAEHILSTTLG